MPRKQRFKPSRKPKAVGTSTDLTPLAQTAQVPGPTKDQDASAVEGVIDGGYRDTDAYAKPTDLGGESG